MSKKESNNNVRHLETCFKPGHLYPLSTVAEMLQVSDEWVKKHLIYRGSCSYKLQGRVYLFQGEWLVEWASSDFVIKGEKHK